jgi:error-prone DNA polymerase
VSSYVELHASSAFSFLQGASLPEALVDRAAELGYSAVALLDRDGVYGAPRFHKAATAAGIKPIIGAELTVTADKSEERSQKSGARQTSDFRLQTCQFLLPVLCENQDGYRNLCRLITRMKLRSPKGEGALTLRRSRRLHGGLVALAGRTVLDGRRYGVGGLLDRLVGIFGRGSVYRRAAAASPARRGSRQRRARRARVGVPRADVATNGVRFATPAARPLFDVLTCIHHHTTLARPGAGWRRTPSGI